MGVCTVVLDVSGTYALLPATSVPPTPRTTLTITGGGMCVVNGQSNVPITVTGSVDFPVDVTSWTCLAGVAAGDVRFEVSPGKFAIDASAITAVSKGGAAISLSAVDDDPRFVAGGQFVQDVASSTACPLSGSMTATWCGVLEFVATAPLPPTSGS